MIFKIVYALHKQLTKKKESIVRHLEDSDLPAGVSFNSFELSLYGAVKNFANDVMNNYVNNVKPAINEADIPTSFIVFSIILRIMGYRSILFTGYSERRFSFATVTSGGLVDWINYEWAFGKFPSETCIRIFTIKLAEFADAIGMSRNDFSNIFPIILRLFGVTSNWSGIYPDPEDCVRLDFYKH